MHVAPEDGPSAYESAPLLRSETEPPSKGPSPDQHEESDGSRSLYLYGLLYLIVALVSIFCPKDKSNAVHASFPVVAANVELVITFVRDLISYLVNLFDPSLLQSLFVLLNASEQMWGSYVERRESSAFADIFFVTMLALLGGLLYIVGMMVALGLWRRWMWLPFLFVLLLPRQFWVPSQTIVSLPKWPFVLIAVARTLTTGYNSQQGTEVEIVSALDLPFVIVLSCTMLAPRHTCSSLLKVRALTRFASALRSHIRPTQHTGGCAPFCGSRRRVGAFTSTGKRPT
jgi:hypothetical protein